MNFLDIALALPLIWGAFQGFRKGLVISVTTLLALGLGIYGAGHFSFVVGDWLKGNASVNPEYLPLVSFLLTFVLIIVLVYFIGKLLEKIVDMLALSILNKAGGIVFGTLKFGLMLSVLLYIVHSLENDFELIPQEEKEASILFEPLSEFALVLIPSLQEEGLIDGFKQSIEKMAAPKLPKL